MADWNAETSEGRSRAATRSAGAADRMIRLTILETSGAAPRSSGTGTVIWRDVGSSTALVSPVTGGGQGSSPDQDERFLEHRQTST
jgi:hypothetical protein